MAMSFIGGENQRKPSICHNTRRKLTRNNYFQKFKMAFWLFMLSDLQKFQISSSQKLLHD
jgi:hypothetical protein